MAFSPFPPPCHLISSTTYGFTYGVFDLLERVSIGDRTLAAYTYTNDQNRYLSALDFGNGGKVQYEYDSKGRVIEQRYEDGAYIRYTYGTDGNLETTYDSATGITAAYSYDYTGQLTRYEETGENHSYVLKYSYDNEAKLINVVEILNGHDRKSTYTYDEEGQLSAFSKVYAGRTYAYDEFDRISSTTTTHQESIHEDPAEVFTTDYTFAGTDDTSSSDQVSVLEHSGPNYNAAYSYTYDGNGNILTVSDGTNTTSYVYDSANQLIRENNQVGNFTHTWVYDAAGNILKRKEYAYTTGSLDGVTATKTVNYTYGDSQWKDKLMAYDGKAINYDNIGNPISDGTWNYTWERGRQFASMSDGNTTWNYTYGANGLRTNRTDGTTNYRYVYEGDKLTFMARNGLYLRFAYTPEGTPLSVLYKGTTYYYVTNLQGDVVAILTGKGYVAVEYTYDAWGNVLSITGSLKDSLGQYNPLRYRGYVYDVETGLYYLQSRYYNPEWGRFINADSESNIGADDGFTGLNLFAYCVNNPVNRFDANGNWSLPNWAKVTIGAVAIAGLAVATVCTGGAAAVICGAALSGAITGGASGAIIGAVGGGITGGWQGALDGACSGFMSGVLVGGLTGAGSAGLNIARGTTTIVGNAHGSVLHKLASNIEAGKMAASGQYSQIGLNRSLKTMGLNGTKRPDVIGIAKNGLNKLVEVVSPKQSTTSVVNKMVHMLNNNPETTGKVVTWVRNIFK